MAKHSSVYTKIWNDPKFRALSPDGKLVFLYLFTNDAISLCGIYEIDPELIQFQTGLKDSKRENAFEEVQKSKMAYYDKDLNLVFIVNRFKYQSKSPQVLKSIVGELSALNEHEFKRLFIEKYGHYLIPYTSCMDTVSIRYLNKEIKRDKKNVDKTYLNKDNVENLKKLFKNDKAIKEHLLNLGFTERDVNEVL